MMTAAEVLRKYQKQCDPEGIEVQVSRQALDEVLDHLEKLQAVVDANQDREILRAFFEAVCDDNWEVANGIRAALMPVAALKEEE